MGVARIFAEFHCIAFFCQLSSFAGTNKQVMYLQAHVDSLSWKLLKIFCYRQKNFTSSPQVCVSQSTTTIRCTTVRVRLKEQHAVCSTVIITILYNIMRIIEYICTPTNKTYQYYLCRIHQLSPNTTKAVVLQLAHHQPIVLLGSLQMMDTACR